MTLKSNMQTYKVFKKQFFLLKVATPLLEMSLDRVMQFGTRTIEIQELQINRKNRIYQTTLTNLI